MKLDEFIKDLNCYLGTVDSTYLLGKKKQLFSKAISDIKKNADELEKSQAGWTALPDMETIEIILESLKYLLAVLNDQVISEDASKFMDSYSTLVYNWNNNVSKNSDINTLTQTINRFVNLRLSTVELIQNLKIMSKKIKELSHISFTPIELSKHYLASFDNKTPK